MAEPAMRRAHLLWHVARDYWTRWEHAAPQLCREFCARFGPAPNPALDREGLPIISGGAGRDFLYMHRLMLAQANGILTSHGFAPFTPWPALPQPGDPRYPVPRSVNYPPAIYKSKDDAHWTAITAEAARFCDPSYLARVTLDQLGAEVEFTIHNSLHERFGGSRLLRPQRIWDPFEPIDPRWDAESYDSLLDPYAAHVNLIFWEIHAWVDARVDDWQSLRGEPLDWGDRWLGPMADAHPEGQPMDDGMPA